MAIGGAVAFDAMIHQPVRLRIMAALVATEGETGLGFTWLRRVVETTDGNLGAHLAALERAGYIATTRPDAARSSGARVTATATGRLALAGHVAYLQALLSTPAAEAAFDPSQQRARS